MNFQWLSRHIFLMYSASLYEQVYILEFIHTGNLVVGKEAHTYSLYISSWIFLCKNTEMQHLVFFLGTSFSSRVWLQCSWQGCCPKVKDQSFLLFINGVETTKIQPAVYPLSLNHPPRPPSSFRCVLSDPTTSRQLLSQRIFTCSFFSESLIFCLALARLALSFPFRTIVRGAYYGNYLAAVQPLSKIGHLRTRRSAAKLSFIQWYVAQYLKWRCSCCSKIPDVNLPYQEIR